MKELTEDAELTEKALNEVVNTTAKENSKARLLVEGKLAEAEEKLGGVELKLAVAASLNLAQANETADLKAALRAYESKWYDKGFADAKRSVEPIVHQARSHGFGEGWLATLQAMGVPEDSPLRNPK